MELGKPVPASTRLTEMILAVLDDCSDGTRCRNIGQWYKAAPTALTGEILKGLEARLSKYLE